MKSRPERRRQAGFSFIEILVVMVIISVLAGLVVKVIPKVLETGKRTKSVDNVSSMLKFYLAKGVGLSKPWPKLNGKNFVLWLVATNEINRSRLQNLEILFSPGDQHYTIEGVSLKEYAAVTLEALKVEGHQDFWHLTSYAGRRNRDALHELSSKQLDATALVICDDDDGDLHHSQGIVTGWTGGEARFMEWSELNMAEPEGSSPKFLGENATNDDLKHMSSEN